MNQDFLCFFVIPVNFNDLIFFRKDILPISIKIKVRADRAESGFGAVSNNAEQVKMKQALLPLSDAKVIIPAVAVSPDLYFRFRQGLTDINILAFNHHKGKAVYKEDDIGDNAVSRPARRIYPELVDGNKGIVLPVIKINKTHDWGLFLGKFVHTYRRII